MNAFLYGYLGTTSQENLIKKLNPILIKFHSIVQCQEICLQITTEDDD